jgi:hypothetical protein
LIWLEASQFGILNAPGGLADLDRVLQRADGFDVLRIVRVDENAHRDDDVSDANPVLAQRMDAGAVDDLGRVLVFVDHLHRQEALAGVRKRDGDRTGVEIEHRRRIERIAVHPDDGLPGERRRLPPMHELAETSVLDDSAENEVRFRPGEIVGGDDDRPIGGGGMGAAKRAQRQRHEQGAGRETERAHSCDGFARAGSNRSYSPGSRLTTESGPFRATALVSKPVRPLTEAAASGSRSGYDRIARCAGLEPAAFR